jgi:hypothetical protein
LKFLFIPVMGGDMSTQVAVQGRGRRKEELKVAEIKKEGGRGRSGRMEQKMRSKGG